MTVFSPPRRGLTFQFTIICLLAVVVAVFAILASQTPIGLKFTVYTLVAAISFLPLPFLAYASYCLVRANYSIDRDTVSLNWGLRIEQIPVADIEWVRPKEALPSKLGLPLLRLPGAITGTHHHPDLGVVEFLASETKSLLLVATSRKVFAISPQDPNGFMQELQHVIEMGSLSPSEAQSVFPVFVVARAWESSLARYFWLAGLFLNIGLLAWVTILIPSLGEISLGFLPSGGAGEPVPGGGLILLPVISLFFFVTGWVAGLTFFRRPEHRPLAYLVWASGVFSTILFLLAVMFIVSTPV